MSDLLQKYNDWPNNKQSLVGVERVVFRITDSVANHLYLRYEWNNLHDSEKAALLDEWRSIATDEFIGSLKEAIEECKFG